MKAAAVEKLVWLLIYSGLVLFSIGVAIETADAAIGWPLEVAGALLTLVGVLLIWVRSRMKGGPR